MLSTESLKKLNLMTPDLDPTGGVPEVTFREVADLLSRVSIECSTFSRLVYALHRDQAAILRRMLTLEISKNQPENYNFIQKIAQLAIAHYVGTESDLLPWEKANYIGLNWWTSRHEELLKSALAYLDGLDYELRSEISRYNDDSLHSG